MAQVQHPVNLDDVCDIVVSLGLGHHHAFALQAQYFSWQVQGRFFFATVTWFFSHSSSLTRKSFFFHSLHGEGFFAMVQRGFFATVSICSILRPH